MRAAYKIATGTSDRVDRIVKGAAEHRDDQTPLGRDQQPAKECEAQHPVSYNCSHKIRRLNPYGASASNTSQMTSNPATSTAIPTTAALPSTGLSAGAVAGIVLGR